jgi:hypothetical protein
MISQIPVKPAARTSDTDARWTETARRRRMLIGAWQEDLEEELTRHVNAERRASWGISDMSSNVFKATCEALSALYNEAPIVGITGADRNQAAPLLASDGLIDRSGLWAMMQQIQVFTLGLREMFLHISLSDSGELLYRPVTPDMIYAEAPAGDPMNMNYLFELRLRPDFENRKTLIWTADVYDIRKGEAEFKIVEMKSDGSFGRDLTMMYLKIDGLRGEAYPYRGEDDRPFIPYSIYHAQITGRLFDAYAQAEVVYGSLTAAALYTYWVHLTRDAGFPQRYIAGLQLAGLSIRDTDAAARRQAIATDPASILVFQSDPDLQGQPMVGQFQAGGDPASVLEAVTQYERRVAQMGGVKASDIQRVSGDPRSGVAIAISRVSMREAQQKYEPSFSRGDLKTIEMSAKICNRFGGYNFPESGYKIRYERIDLTMEELKAQREDILAKLTAGLMSPIDAIKELYPDMDDADAAEKIAEIKRQKVIYAM